MTSTIHHSSSAAPVDAEPQTQGRRYRSTTRRLLVSELRLLGRDPLTLTFVLVFPIVTMLIIGGWCGDRTRRGVPGESLTLVPGRRRMASPTK